MSLYACSARRGEILSTIAVRMPASTISVPAAGTQLRLNVNDDKGSPLLVTTSSPGHWKVVVNGFFASASFTALRFAIEKIAMMMRYGA